MAYVGQGTPGKVLTAHAPEGRSKWLEIGSESGLTDHGILLAQGTDAFVAVAPSSTSGVAIVSQGASADPAYGIVMPAGGGTGSGSLTGVLTGNGTSPVTASTITQYGTVVAGASNSVSSVAPSATSGVPLISQGASSNPAFGTAVVAGGGTGATSLTGVLTGNGTSAITANAVTQYGTVIAGASNAVSSVAPSATSGVPYISQGASSNPTFGTAVVAGGGTGRTSTTAYAVLCGGTTSTGALQPIAGVGSAGQVLTSNGAGALPTFQAAAGGGTNITTYIVKAGTTYSTIQSAINQAVTDGATNTNQALVAVTQGTYTENITLKPGVNIIGYDYPKLNGYITSSAAVDTVEIRNLRIGNATTSVLLTVDGFFVKFYDCTFDGTFNIDNQVNIQMDFYNLSNQTMTITGTGAASAQFYFYFPFNCQVNDIDVPIGINVFGGSCNFYGTLTNGPTLSLIGTQCYSGTTGDWSSLSAIGSIAGGFSATTANYNQSTGSCSGTTLTGYNSVFDNVCTVTDMYAYGCKIYNCAGNLYAENCIIQDPTSTVLINNPSSDYLVTGCGVCYNYRTITGDETLVKGDYYVGVNNAALTTITLTPANYLPGQYFIIKDESGNASVDNIDVTPSSGTIDGVATKSITTDYGKMQIIFDGTDFWVTA